MTQYNIEMSSPEEEFALCWSAAGMHLSSFGDGAINNWLRSHLNPPFLEHLSFRMGNQLFFIRVEDEDEALLVPGTRSGLDMVATKSEGYACLMPMKKTPQGWEPSNPG